MRSTWHPAPAVLSDVMAGIWSVEATGRRPLSARVLPDGSTCLVLQRDGTVLRSRDVRGPWPAAAVSGPRTGPFDFTLDPGGRIFIAQLRPAGAARVLGVPMSSMVDRSEPLDAVAGPISARLLDRVAEAVDAPGVAALETWLLERVRAEGTRCPVSEFVVATTVHRAGSVRVDELATGVALSRRQLGRIMNERVGLAPKLFARIARFDHAVRLGREMRPTPWARIAVEAGYSDQAHLTREFMQLGGIRPRELRGPSAAMIW